MATWYLFFLSSSFSFISISFTVFCASGNPFNATAIVKSVPSFKVGAIGIGLIIPPSTSVRPFDLKGENIIGTAMDAAIASNNGPFENQTSFCFIKSVATAVKPIGKSSML